MATNQREVDAEIDKIYPTTNYIFYKCHFCKQEFNIIRNDKSGFYMVGNKGKSFNHRKQVPVCNDCIVAGKVI